GKYRIDEVRCFVWHGEPRIDDQWNFDLPPFGLGRGATTGLQPLRTELCPSREQPSLRPATAGTRGWILRDDRKGQRFRKRDLRWRFSEIDSARRTNATDIAAERGDIKIRLQKFTLR